VSLIKEIPDLEHIIKLAERLGASYADVRYQEYWYEMISAENGQLREYSKTLLKGIGIRVMVGNGIGFSSTNDLSQASIKESIKKAIEAAKALSKINSVKLLQPPIYRDKLYSSHKLDPREIPPEDKVSLIMDINKSSLLAAIKSSISRLGIQFDRRVFSSSDGSNIEVASFTVGIAQLSVAHEAGIMERVFDSKSAVAGWEYIKSIDWLKFSEDVSSLAIKAVKAKTPPAGTFTAVADPDLVGLILHEAFGHASEGDLVVSGTSVLKGKLGDEVASELVNIVDDGLVDGGYFIPYDDEGVKKIKTVIVKDGVLKGYLTHRTSASELDQPLTGNGRAQDFENIPIVRQTNYFMMPKDYSFEELIEDIEYGFYLKGRGAGGGQVDTGMGTFTFSVGPSYIIRKGEISELVRGVVVSGSILETLKGVDAVGKDLQIKTSVFGACGKDGQRARVGAGGPHIRIKKIIIGGR
jgi:TldD protein